MKVVIQCAARKAPGAARLITGNGKPVLFLAHPGLAPPDTTTAYARPDDPAGGGETWRARLREYNEVAKTNPLNLLPAYRLYANGAYRAVVDRFGLRKVFILSAGWGLIPADLLTPDYDITFTASADPWKRRRHNERFEDFCMMPDDGESIVFLGGKDYLPLFCRLTGDFSGGKTVFFNAAQSPSLPSGFSGVRFHTRTRTNWHYECAAALVAGEIRI